jgi:hypothetical protein
MCSGYRGRSTLSIRAWSLFLLGGLNLEMRLWNIVPTLWAYVTDFRLLAFLTLACVPFLLLFRRGGVRRAGILPL